MDHNTFDRLTRTFAKSHSRRGMLAAAAAITALRGKNAAAVQLGPATCGALGEVCTMLLGCCEGLTCVTSAINVNYGICVAGSGGTITTGTTLISPFSEGAAEEVASLAADATTAATTASTTGTTTDPQAEREQRLADKKARKTARNNRQDSRNLTRKNRRQDQKDARKLRRGPKLGLRIINPGGAQTTETLRVTNLDDGTAFINRIESVLAPGDGMDLPTPMSLTKGEFVQFLSGSGSEDDRNIVWFGAPICSDPEAVDGFTVYASFSTDLENRDYTIFCDGTRPRNRHKNRNRNKQKHNANTHKRKKHTNG